MKYMEVEPNDLDKMEEKEQQEKMAAYEKRQEESGTGDFLKIKHVLENEIKIVKFTKWLGLRLTTFTEGENQDRPNFNCEVMVGKNKGAVYTVNLTDATVRELKKQGMPKALGKEWCDKPLDVSKGVGGKGDYIKYAMHVNL